MARSVRAADTEGKGQLTHKRFCGDLRKQLRDVGRRTAQLVDHAIDHVWAGEGDVQGVRCELPLLLDRTAKRGFADRLIRGQVGGVEFAQNIRDALATGTGPPRLAVFAASDAAFVGSRTLTATVKV